MTAPFRSTLSQEVVRLNPGGPPGQAVLTVQNLGTGIEDYQVEVELAGQQPSWPKWITLAPATLIGFYPVGTPDQPSEGQVTVTIQPPADLNWAAGRYPLRLRVFPKGEPDQARDVELRLEVPATHDLSLHIDPEEQSGLLEDSFWLEVENQGNASLALGFRASDEQQGCIYEFEPAELQVPVGGTASAELKVRARAPLTQRGGRFHRFRVEAYLLEEPSRTWQASGMWRQVTPALTLDLSPKEGRGSTEGRFSVQVGNAGESDLTVQLKVKESARDGEYRFQPAQMLVPARGSAGSKLTIRPRAGVQGGRTFPFVIAAQAVEAPAAVAEQPGEWVWTPAIARSRRKIWPFIAAGALLIVAIILAVILSQDRQPPRASISAEPAKPEIGEEVTFTAEASDNRKLKSLAIVVDGKKHPCDPPDRKCTVYLAFSEAGEVAYYAEARDGVGNETTTSKHMIDVVARQDGAVTSASVTDYSSPYQGPCPVERTASAEIVTDGPAEVEYQWMVNGSAVGGASTLSFQEAGSQETPPLTWLVDASGLYEVHLHVLSPNDMYSDPAEVEVNCEEESPCPITEQGLELTLLDATDLTNQPSFVQADTRLKDVCHDLELGVHPAPGTSDPNVMRALIESAVAEGLDVAAISGYLLPAIQDLITYQRELPSGRTLVVLSGSQYQDAAKELVDWLVAQLGPDPEPLCTVVSRPGLYLRPGPGTVYEPEVATISTGDTLRPLAFNAGGFPKPGEDPQPGWIEVQVVGTGQTGWVRFKEDYISCNVDSSDLPEKTSVPPTPTPPPVLVPDLTVESITFDPMPPIQNQTCRVRIVVRNDGNGAVDAFSWEWQPGSHSPLGGNVTVGLGGGDSTTVTAEWVPASSYPSLATVARVDPANALLESNEDNNELETSVEVVRLLPDLKVEITSIKPPTIRADEKALVRFRVTNTGDETTPSGPISLQVWANGTPAQIYKTIDGPIQPGGWENGTFIISGRSPWHLGVNMVQMEVDYDNEIEESDDSNNRSATMPLRVLSSSDVLVPL